MRWDRRQRWALRDREERVVVGGGGERKAIDMVGATGDLKRGRRRGA